MSKISTSKKEDKQAEKYAIELGGKGNLDGNKESSKEANKKFLGQNTI